MMLSLLKRFCMVLVVCGLFLGMPSMGHALDLNGATVGAVVEPAFDATNFYGDGSLTWTVSSDDQTTFAWTIVNEEMTVWFVLNHTSLSGNGNQVNIKIPNGRTALTDVDNMCFLLDNGVRTVGTVGTGDNVTYISVSRLDMANFTQTTNGFYARGQVSFKVGASQ